ncbi:MAG: PQQ-binding-like beta-propeller repeat protein [Planctomycetes bacterium]|nr:PQQ-binding-like beta-propeller repeat protein [Planctomycetota bacterium]
MRACVVAVIFVVAGAAPPAAAQDQRAPANQLHYPLSDDLADMLRSANAARGRGELEAAIDLYRAVLDQDGGGRGGYQLAPAPAAGRGQPRRYLGVTEQAIAGLRALPPAGVKLFRARYDFRAGSAFDAARGAPEPFVALARVYELYPISGHATRILEAMADLALERGDLERAARTLEALLAHHRDELPDPTRVRRKQLLCAVGLGQPERVRALAPALQEGQRRGWADDLVLRAIEAEERRAGRTQDAGPWLHLVRADPANRAAVDARPAVGPARFAPRTFESQGAAGGFERFMPGQPTAQVPPSRHLPLLHGGRVFVSTADQVFTFDARTGDPGPRISRLGPHFPDGNAKAQFGGAITRETFVAPLVNDVVNEQQFRGIPIKVKIPLRKLAGFDIPNWRWLWNHARTLDGTPYERWSFPAPPTAVEGLVFAPAFALEGFVNCHVAAFDARTGERVWTTWVVSGQVEQTMFGEHSTEPLCAPVAVSDGVVYYSSSFGCAAALDATTGRPLWVTEYEQIEVRPPKGFYPEPRDITWENNAVSVVSGVVVVAPLDSPTFVGLDARTGERLWEARQRVPGAAGMLSFIVAASQHDAEGAVVLGGGAEVRCVGARSGKLLWRADVRGRTVAGRGCVADGAVLVPLSGNEVALFDLVTGKRSGTLSVGLTGNIMLVGEHALVTGGGKLVVHRIGSRDF